jgi:hypothetical protein
MVGWMFVNDRAQCRDIIGNYFKSVRPARFGFDTIECSSLRTPLYSLKIARDTRAMIVAINEIHFAMQPVIVLYSYKF